MNNPQISVIVPVYNAEKWLRRCVDSILAQTFTDFELLLIDDGSTDGSPAMNTHKEIHELRYFTKKTQESVPHGIRDWIMQEASGSCLWMPMIIYMRMLLIIY